MKCFKPVLPLLLIKNWYFVSYGSLAYKYILSISGYWFIRLNVFPNSKPHIINILYGWLGISGQFGLCSFMFSFVTSLKVIFFFVLVYYIVAFNHFFFTYWIDCILLSSFELKSNLIKFFSKSIMHVSFKFCWF